jgi:hypothetical protein
MAAQITLDRISKIEDLAATKEDLVGFAKSLGVKVAKNADEVAIAAELHESIAKLPTAEWEQMEEEVQNWDIATCTAVKEIVEAEEKEAKKPKPKRQPAPKETLATAGTKPPEAPEMTDEEIIQACKNKKQIVEAAEKLGCDFDIKMSWKVADMKKKVIAALAAKNAPADPPKRVAADPNATEPSAKDLAAAKAAAKSTAKEKKTKKRKNVEGEPFARNTTAWLIWNTVRIAKKALTRKEIQERYLAAFEAQSEVKSSNPAGRMNPVMNHMRSNKMIIAGPTEGTYVINPDWVAAE